MLFARCLVPFLAVPLAFAADIAVIDEIVAKVNGDIITQTDLARDRRKLETELKQRGATAPQVEAAVKERSQDTLRERIDQLLLVQKAKEMNVNVDQQMSKYLSSIQLENKIADQDKFAAFIREQTGLPFEDFKSEIRNSMMTQRVIGQEVQSKINVPTADVRKYYDEHKPEFMREERVFLREILLRTEGKTPEQVAAIDKKSKDLVARARKGEKFPEMARDNSDADSAKQFGDIGAWKKGELSPELEKMVFTGGKGYVTDPVKTGNGLAIFKVEEIHKAGQAEFEDVENEVKEKLYSPKMGPAMREYLTKLRQDAFLEIRDNYVDSGAAPGKLTKWTDPALLKPETISKEELESQTRRRRLLWMIPVPGTKTSVAKKAEPTDTTRQDERDSKGTSSSKTYKEK